MTGAPAPPPRGRRAHRPPSVTALIPAYNEEDTVGATVEALGGLPSIGGSGEIIVIDDGSRDATARRAREAGARVIRARRRRGKAGAVRLGIARSAGSLIVLVDADTGPTAAAADILLEAVASGAADLAIGIVPPEKPVTPREHTPGAGGPDALVPASPGRGRRGFGLAVGLARWGIYRLGGCRMVQPLSGQRAFYRRLADDMSYWGWGFGLETALTIHALKKGGRVVELAAPFRHRVTDMDWRGLLHRGRQTVHVAGTLAALAMGGALSPAEPRTPETPGR